MAKFPDAFVEFAGSLKRIGLVVLQVAKVFDQSGFDMFVVQKLGEDHELLSEELISKIDLQRNTMMRTKEAGEGTNKEALELISKAV